MKKDIRILTLLMAGKTFTEIGEILRPKMTRQGIYARVKKIREKLISNRALHNEQYRALIERSIQSPIGPQQSLDTEILNSRGFQIRSEAEMKEEDYRARQAEAEIIRRVKEGAEILAEEIEDLV